MKIKIVFRNVLGLMVLGVCVDATHADPATAPASQALDDAARSIVLPIVQTQLPPGPKAGRDIASTSCAFCHSTRYILNQPSFPRQTWINEVQKMRTTFAAPIAEQQVPDIVDYLVAIRGVQEPKTKP